MLRGTNEVCPGPGTIRSTAKANNKKLLSVISHLSGFLASVRFTVTSCVLLFSDHDERDRFYQCRCY